MIALEFVIVCRTMLITPCEAVRESGDLCRVQLWIEAAIVAPLKSI